MRKRFRLGSGRQPIGGTPMNPVVRRAPVLAVAFVVAACAAVRPRPHRRLPSRRRPRHRPRTWHRRRDPRRRHRPPSRPSRAPRVHVRGVRVHDHGPFRLVLEPGDEGLGRELGSVVQIRRGGQPSAPGAPVQRGSRHRPIRSSRRMRTRWSRPRRSTTGTPAHPDRRPGSRSPSAANRHPCRVRLRNPDQQRGHRAQGRRLSVPAPRPRSPCLHRSGRSEELLRAPSIGEVSGVTAWRRALSRRSSAGSPCRARASRTARSCQPPDQASRSISRPASDRPHARILVTWRCSAAMPSLHPELFEVELALDIAQGHVVDLARDRAAR